MNLQMIANWPWSRARRLAAVACTRWGFAAFSVLFFCVYLATMRWDRTLEGLFRPDSNAGLAMEARRLGLTYEAALADPKAAVEKPVIWCVDHPAMNYAYAEGKPSQPLLLNNPGAFPINSPTTGGPLRPRARDRDRR